MSCPKCRRPLANPNAKFCSYCGASLSGNMQTQRMTPGTPTLTIQTPGHAPYQINLAKPIITIGRAAKNDIVIPDPYVGGEHARLEKVDSTYRIIDLQSRNGTLVNGQRVEQQILNSGDIIRIGDLWGNSTGLTFQSGSAVIPRAPRTLDLRQPMTMIGRDTSSTLVLSDQLVSMHHAEVRYDGTKHLLTDLDSTNGTYVNGTRIPARQPYILHLNDIIQIGPYQFRYDRSGISSSQVASMRLDGRNLHVWRGGVLTLNDVTVVVESGKFICLIGGSGAGKSTLMKALNGDERASQGTVLINGADFYAKFDAFRSHIGYVPQDDILHKNIPVRRALRYAAELRTPPGTDIEALLDNVLKMVELTAHQNKSIKNLSGGQRKRASIALELLASPGLFFLDEPTSGLDPGLEKNAMNLMRRIADNGHTVILVTHSIANIDMCDAIAFMAKGRLVFYGHYKQAEAFFGQPFQKWADVYQMLAEEPDPNDKDSVARKWEEKFKTSVYYQENILQPAHQPPQSVPPSPLPKPSRWKQWWVLARRQMDMILRDKLTLGILLFVLPLIGLLTLLIAKSDFLVGLDNNAIQTLIDEGKTYSPAGDANKLIFIIALAAVLLGIFAGAYEVVREQAIFKRERMVNLDIFPYLLSKLGVLFVFAVVQAALFLWIISLGVTLPDKGIFMPAAAEFYVTLLIAICASIALGLCISAIAQSENMVIYIILLILFLQILFAGVIFELPGAAKPLSYVTTAHWTIDALGSSADIPALHEKTRFPKPKMPAGVPAPDEADRELPKLPIEYKHEITHLLSRWAILASFALIFLGLTFVTQKNKDDPSLFLRAWHASVKRFPFLDTVARALASFRNAMASLVKGIQHLLRPQSP